MGKLNLSEAAKEILNASLASKKGGQDKSSKLNGNVAYGTKETDVGHTPLKTTDANPDYTSGVPSATPPGASPPVGSEPMKRLSRQPQEQGTIEQPEGKTGKQMMQPNKGSVGVQQYEDTEYEDDDLIEEELLAQFEQLIEDINVINEVSLGAKIKAFAHHSSQSFEHGDSGNDDESEHHQKRADKILANISKHHGSDAVKHAEKAADSSIFGTDRSRSRGTDKLSGGLRHGLNQNITKSGKIPKSTQSAMKNRLKEEKDEGHEDEAEDKKMIKKMMAKKNMKEDIDALLEGENLSEEFAQKATIIFEAAVQSRAEEVIAEATAELTEQFEEAVEIIKEDLASKVDDYLNYMVEEWIKENEIAIEKGLRAEIVEDFIEGLRDLFAEHYIDIPAEKVDVVEELTDKVTELEDSLNEQIKTAIELKKELNEHKKNEAIYTACEGLTQTQVEKMKSLAEGVEFSTEDEFASKIATLKESYFKANVKVADSSALDEVLIEEEPKKATSGDPMMEQYVKSISKTLIK